MTATITTLAVITAVLLLCRSAAPAPTARVAPTGKMLGNGWQTNITFATHPSVNLWEVEVTPFGMDGGEAIDITTQLNDKVMTKHAAKLYDLTDGSATVNYDPAVLTALKTLINLMKSGSTAQVVTYLFPDGSSWCAYGYLKSFKPGSLVNKKRPTAEIGIVHTNWDPINCVEAEPVLTAGTGSCS